VAGTRDVHEWPIDRHRDRRDIPIEVALGGAELTFSSPVRQSKAEPTDGSGKPQLERDILPKTPTRKLKVFQAPFGFFDTILAAPSQAAALRAWGTHRNLFADGARQARDGRGGNCRCLGAPRNSAAARCGIERSLCARAGQLAEDPGFASTHARLQEAGA
jgi:hypothetical protein